MVLHLLLTFISFNSVGVNKMKKLEMTRLNLLFEKMVSNKTNIKEQRELTKLYQTYIDEDREVLNNVTPIHTQKHAG